MSLYPHPARAAAAPRAAAPGAQLPYQVRGAAFLAARSRAILGDQMGLGKSAQAIAALDEIGARSGVILTPASVRPHWAREIATWSRRAWTPQVVETTTEAIEPAAT